MNDFPWVQWGQLVEISATDKKPRMRIGWGSLSPSKLEGAELAPGSEATKVALAHPEKRPKTRQIVSRTTSLHVVWTLTNSWSPACWGQRHKVQLQSMSSEYLRPFLDNERDMSARSVFGNSFARGEVLADVVECAWGGWPDGGVRGIGVRDMFRRLVTRILASQFVERGGCHVSTSTCSENQSRLRVCGARVTVVDGSERRGSCCVC